jgi:uncharacterized surface protein with fasciclin (FAS1) repeats
MSKMKLFAGVAAFAALSLVAACQPAKKEEAPAPVVEAPAPPPAPVLVNIVDTAVANGSFGTLVTAVTAAGLADALKAPGPLTVFAPNDEAFKKVDAKTLEGLLKPEGKDKLAAILKHHVVSGAIKSADIAAGKTEVETLNGKVTVEKAADGAVTFGGAKVVGADVEASNGVIHVIDTVVLPKK